MEKSIDLFEYTKKVFHINDVDLASYSPLALAYIGDGVYEVIIRTVVLAKHNASVDKMHKLTSKYAKAVTQAEIIALLLDELTEKELLVYKRGRNTKTGSVAKNATLSEYKSATGLETLIGYLYLTGNIDRAIELIHMGIQKHRNQ